ncbi:hypothetical protein AAU01_05330 [Paenarthrobacter aurescens]|uniref:Uncharacterized protein n=1 Tax=Paenarthrobacter aurescens TaxID=43663 RepID=A0A4Y3NFE0_PAEAU|nr:hypothetical protein AAU01_05330 [Paenarthrobacter aurescens]
MWDSEPAQQLFLFIVRHRQGRLFGPEHGSHAAEPETLVHSELIIGQNLRPRWYGLREERHYDCAH